MCQFLRQSACLESESSDSLCIAFATCSNNLTNRRPLVLLGEPTVWSVHDMPIPPHLMVDSQESGRLFKKDNSFSFFCMLGKTLC